VLCQDQARVRKLVNSGRLTRMGNVNSLQADAGQASQPRVVGTEGGTSTRAIEPAIDSPKLREIGGPKGIEPTRFGDWERAGRCIDF